MQELKELDAEPDDWIEPGCDDPVTSEEFFDSVAAEILGQPKKFAPYTKEMLAEDKKLVSWTDGRNEITEGQIANS